MSDLWRTVISQCDFDENGCLVFGGYLDPNGYGQVQRSTKTHRVLYEAVFGSLPKGLVIHHQCENKACVNPRHLVALTRAEHRQRHWLTHCKHGHALTPENTYWHPQRHMRHCLACSKERDRQRGVRRKTPCVKCGSMPGEEHRIGCGYRTRRMANKRAA